MSFAFSESLNQALFARSVLQRNQDNYIVATRVELFQIVLALIWHQEIPDGHLSKGDCVLSGMLIERSSTELGDFVSFMGADSWC
jgi:hypothetical protein